MNHHFFPKGKTMRTSLTCAATIAALLCSSAAWAAPVAPGVDKALSDIAQLGPGVHAIKKDAKGRITSCIVVGQSRISTVLGKAKGLQTARERARLDASAQFTRWLRELVLVFSKSDDETILFLEGSEDNDKDALTESGKAVEKTSQKMVSIALGLVRGLQLLHVEVSDKDKTYTIVMGWDAKTAAATRDVKEINDTGISSTTGKPKKPIDKKIEDKKVTSPDAKKFLP
jgi:hypothetical protein